MRRVLTLLIAGLVTGPSAQQACGQALNDRQELSTLEISRVDSDRNLTPAQGLVRPFAQEQTDWLRRHDPSRWSASPVTLTGRRAGPSAPPHLVQFSDDDAVGTEAPSAGASDSASDPPSKPDISNPGPDMGDFPNSAFTLPKGRWYFESGPATFQTADSQNPSNYTWPFLIRYGVTNDMELRLLGSGLTSTLAPSNTTGFGPLIIDTKIHLWNDRMENWIPAASFEAYLQTDWGSPAFRGGIQPSLNMNFDFPITKKTNIEMSFGYTGVQTTVHVLTGFEFVPRLNHEVPVIHDEADNGYQFSYQWAVEQQLTDEFQVFVHGQYLGAVLRSPPSTIVGAGFFYQLSPRSITFASFNAGLDELAPPFSTQFGIAFAF